MSKSGWFNKDRGPGPSYSDFLVKGVVAVETFLRITFTILLDIYQSETELNSSPSSPYTTT